MRKQDIFLPFNEPAFLPGDPRVFGFADFIESFSKGSQHMAFVE